MIPFPPVFLYHSYFGVDFHFLSTPRYYWAGDCQKMKKMKVSFGIIFPLKVVSFLSLLKNKI
jgi:hypothetical protein